MTPSPEPAEFVDPVESARSAALRCVSDQFPGSAEAAWRKASFIPRSAGRDRERTGLPTEKAVIAAYFTGGLKPISGKDDPDPYRLSADERDLLALLTKAA